MCDCGTTEAGGYLATIGGQIGDRGTAMIRGLGGNMAKRFKNWTGLGDYEIHSNSLINAAGSGDGRPIITTQGRETRVSYREYLGDVYIGPDNGFHATTYEINPANVITFPWLAPIAQQYDQYKAMGIIFEFKSTATTTTTAASLGSVMMATEYDVADSAFTNKVQMLNSAYSSEAKSSEDMVHGIECDPRDLQHNLYYTRGVGKTVSDIRDFDMAKFTVATQGGGLNPDESIGSLYVHYDFIFMKEQLFGGLAAENKIYSVIELAPPNLQSGVDLSDLDANFGVGVPIVTWGRDLGIVFTPTEIKFPRKWAGTSFKVIMNVKQTTGTTPVAPSGFTLTHISPLNIPVRVIYPLIEEVCMWDSAQGGTGAVHNSSSFVFKIDDIVQSQFAVIEILNTGVLPTGNGTGRLNRITFEVIPADYFSLQ